MQNKNKKTFEAIAYITLVILALLVLVNNLLPLVGVNITGTLMHILDTVSHALTLLIISVLAFAFIQNKGKAWVVIYWIAIAIFIAGVVLLWFI